MEQEKPFSQTLATILHLSKRHKGAFTYQLLKEHLGKIYHPDMRLKDVLLILNNAMLEAFKHPKFELSNRDQIQFEIMIEPFAGFVPVGAEENQKYALFGPTLDYKCSIEQFYDKIISGYMHRLMMTNISWCYSYVFPEETDGGSI